MEYFNNCNTSGLNTHTAPLTKMQAAHLYRRLGFSASAETINAAVGQTASALVATIVNASKNLAPIATPAWANWDYSDYPTEDLAHYDAIRNQRNTLTNEYMTRLMNENLADRMSFFWSNHIVTELEVYDCNPFLFEYVNCLQRNGLGNFKTLISEVGVTSAMLYYLDGVYNNGGNPNENYARELYELFTLGDGNGYTEEDIIETAKALSGYVKVSEIRWTPVTFDADAHNTDTKTIFGQTGNWGYDDVIDILFEQRSNEIAWFICKKLYEYFVHPDSADEGGNAETIIQGLKTTFINSDFEIAPVLTQLFTSEHFFDADAIGVIIKSPFDLFLNLINETAFSYNDDMLVKIKEHCKLLSQDIFDPIDVAGWQRNRSWINTNFMIGRWLIAEYILQDFFIEDEEQFRAFGIAATGPNGTTTNDPDEVARAIIDKLTPKGLLTEVPDYSAAFAIFRGPYDSDMVYQNGSWNMLLTHAPTQVYLLLLHIVRQPEFQLK